MSTMIIFLACDHKCQLQDWQRWGQKALTEKRNKHLFLLANYEKSDYIPARFAQINALLGLTDELYQEVIDNLMSFITRSSATDELAERKQQQAYCLFANMALNEQDYAFAFSWAKACA